MRGRVEVAREKLVDPATGLPVSAYRLDGETICGPGGWSLWLAAHMLWPVDRAWAEDQYHMATNPKLEPLTCSACGAPLPLPDGTECRCAHCGALRPVPAAHLALRAQAEEARQARRRAEEAWGRVPKPLPSWFIGVATALLLVATTAVTTAALVSWAIYGLFRSAGSMLIYGVFTPALLFVLCLVEALASSSQARRVEALSALLPEKAGAAPRCRICGAPLALEPGCLAATCDYCHADNLVTRLASRTQARLERERRQAEQSLEDAVNAAWSNRDDRRLARIVTLCVLAACWIGLWFAFRGV